MPTGEIPFRVMFDTEAIIPVEVGLTSIRVKAYEEQMNQQELKSNLDLIDEVRDEALKRMTKYKRAMARNYNKKVKVRRFDTSDLVLQKVSQATNDPSKRRLGPVWEGPYEVIPYSRQGLYYLKTLDDQELPCPWNIEHLKKYYQ